MNITPKKELKLDYRPEFLRSGDMSDTPLFYDAEGGRITLLAADFSPAHTFDAGFPIASCAADAGTGRIAVVRASEAICVFDFKGEKGREIEGNYVCAAFDGNGLLWGIERSGPELLTWNVFGVDYGPAASLDIDDSMYESHASLTACPESGKMILELAAGQDGAALFLLAYAGGKPEATEMFPEECFSGPCFGDDGSGLLVQEFYEETVCRYSYPQLEKLGEYYYEQSDEEESEPGETLFCAGPDHAVISQNSRYYLLDLDRMAVRDEIIIAGHEPRPAETYYPSLGEDKTLMTDIPCLARRGGAVLGYTHFRDGYTLLAFDAADFAALADAK
jgi:hypothetical protein